MQAKLAIQPSPAAAALHRAAAHIARSVVQLAARRASTLSKTKMSMAKARAGAVPYARSRRESVSYKNVEAHEDYGSFILPYKAKDDAVKNKIVWSGLRANVPWSTGFAAAFWNTYSDDDTVRTSKGGSKEWRCAHRFEGVCQQPDWEKSHLGLEIGHIQGFYSHIASTVNTKVRCDGARHWLVMLYDDVVAANEDISNLQPQCKKCNRDPRQKSKDDQGAGKYQPEEQGLCPGEDCAFKKF